RDLAARATEDATTVPGITVDEEALLAHPLLAAAPRLVLWRAPTDNDRIGGVAAAGAPLRPRRLGGRPPSGGARGAAVVVTAAVVAVHSAGLDDLFTPYIRPQESGGLSGVRWFAVGADEGRASLVVHLDEPRQVSLTRHHALDLAAATHSDELVPRPEVVVHI